MKGIIELVDDINAAIVSGTASPKFAGKVIHGLTEPRTHKTNHVAPCIISKEGIITPIHTDEKIPLIVYHRIHRTAYDYNIPASFGKGWSHKAVSSMSLFVWGMRKRLNMQPTELELFIISLIPQTSSAELKTKLALKSVHIGVDGCEHDSAAILKKEWNGSNAPSIPESGILLELRYTIGYSFKTSCAIPCCN